LEEAKKQLHIAQLLGYTSKSDTTYVNLKKSIEKIEDKLKSNKHTSLLFSELKQKINEFKEKAISILHK
jgi:predicted transcriptional regulator